MASSHLNMAELDRIKYHIPAECTASHQNRQAWAVVRGTHSSDNHIRMKYVEERSVQDVSRKDLSKYYDHFPGILVLTARRMFVLQWSMEKGQDD